MDVVGSDDVFVCLPLGVGDLGGRKNVFDDCDLKVFSAGGLSSSSRSVRHQRSYVKGARLRERGLVRRGAELVGSSVHMISVVAPRVSVESELEIVGVARE